MLGEETDTKPTITEYHDIYAWNLLKFFHSRLSVVESEVFQSSQLWQ